MRRPGLAEALERRGVSAATWARAQNGPGGLVERLVSAGVLADTVAAALGEHLGLEVVDPMALPVDLPVVWKIPREMAQKLRVLVIDAPSPRQVRVVMADPRDPEVISTLEFRLGASVRPLLGSLSRIEEAISRFYGMEAIAGRVLGQVAPGFRAVVVAPETLELDAEKLGEMLQKGGVRPYVDLVNFVLVTAVDRGASDIHIEPQADSTRIRFRIDGMLQQVVTLPIWAHAPFTSRIKVIGNMDVSDTRRPLDGKADLNVGSRTLTARISTVPSRHGENVVIRLLDPSVVRVDLAELGWPAELIARYYRLISAPAGLVLVSGPTGSGKSTTLYATIHRLNTESRSIVTVEDPIEYALPGITQVQVNHKAGVTFDSTIRSLLRQDPNVLVVGEIRDGETAQAAVEAANTGHLVLSTLHTANAVAALTRLLDLGVPPYLLGASLTGVVSQRLLRRVCPSCARPGAPTPEEWALVGLPPVDLGPSARLVGPGCVRCNNTGYRGRIGIYELLLVDDTLARLVQERASESRLWEHAMSLGIRTLLLDALDKVYAGVTTLEELARVVPVGEYPDAIVRQAVSRLGVRASAEKQGSPSRSVIAAPEPPLTQPTEAQPTEAQPTEAQAAQPTEAQPAQTTQAQPTPAAPRRARPLVLIVDDAEEILSLVQLSLEDDYDLCVARDGEEALQVVAARAPDLLVLDVMMPRLSGFQVAERLRASPDTQRIPILMLSARGQTEHVKRGLHAGADDYLPKPFDPEELLLRVRALLRRAG